jgi:hypothetical protein
MIAFPTLARADSNLFRDFSSLNPYETKMSFFSFVFFSVPALPGFSSFASQIEFETDIMKMCAYFSNA